MKKNKNKKILIAEDDQVLLQIYEKHLRLKGYDVFITTNGKDAEKIALQEKPALILLDIIMPGQDGFKTLSNLQANKRTKKIPVVLLTNLGQEKDVHKGRDMGAKGYLVKNDVTPQEVIVYVEKILKKFH